MKSVSYLFEEAFLALSGRWSLLGGSWHPNALRRSLGSQALSLPKSCWSKSAGAEGLQSRSPLPCGTCGTAKGSGSHHAGASGGSPLLDVGTWRCLWERRNQKAEAVAGGKVAETAAIPFLLQGGRTLWKRLCGQLASGFPSRDRKTRIRCYGMERKPWEDSSDQEDGAELSPRLCLPGLQPGSWPSSCPGSWPRWLSATGLPRLGAGFSPGKPLLPRIFCFLIGKLKFLGKTCRFCRKSSFWWRVALTRRVWLAHPLALQAEHCGLG